MVKWTRVSIVIALLVLLASVASLAQDQGGGGAFAQMQEKYKYTFQLMSMARHIGEIDKDPKYALTQTQAKQVLAVLQPWRSKPKMTQDQAKDVLKNLKKVFNVNQLNAMARIKPRPRTGQQGGGMRPGGQGGPGGGQGRPDGNRPKFDPNAMKDFNPFYAKAAKGDEFAVRRAARWNDLFKDLTNRSKGIKTAPKATKAKAPAKGK